MVLENLENYLLGCYDVIGLMLMIKVTHSQRLVMQRRRVPILDAFFDRISLLLWPRLKFVLDANLKAMRGTSLARMGIVDLTPHYITRRYAELFASMLLLQQASGSGKLGGGGGFEGGAPADSMGIAGGGEAMLSQDLCTMRVEMSTLLERLATQLPGAKEQRVFLINNLDQVLQVAQERQVEMNAELQQLEDMLLQQRELYTEDELAHSFSNLTSFVVQTEKAINATAEKGSGRSSVRISLDETVVEGLVREFSSGWKAGIQRINENVMAYFANFRNGMEILKQVLTQLLLYYTRFQDIIKRSWQKPPTFSRDIVSTATILMEIKKYSRAF